VKSVGGRRRAKGLGFIRFPVSNSRSLPTHTRREHLPLDASLFYELSFSNFPLLYSYRSGVTCPYPADAKQRGFFCGVERLPDVSLRPS
jgi:hypothetical protein